MTGYGSWGWWRIYLW